MGFLARIIDDTRPRQSRAKQAAPPSIEPPWEVGVEDMSLSGQSASDASPPIDSAPKSATHELGAETTLTTPGRVLQAKSAGPEAPPTPQINDIAERTVATALPETKPKNPPTEVSSSRPNSAGKIVAVTRQTDDVKAVTAGVAEPIQRPLRVEESSAPSHQRSVKPVPEKSASVALSAQNTEQRQSVVVTNSSRSSVSTAAHRPTEKVEPMPNALASARPIPAVASNPPAVVTANNQRPSQALVKPAPLAPERPDAKPSSAQVPAMPKVQIGQVNVIVERAEAPTKPVISPLVDDASRLYLRGL